MPSRSSCANCGRRIEDGQENRLNGKVYGPECVRKVADNLSTPPLQEEAFEFCQGCGIIEGTEHKFWCTVAPEK